MITILLRWLRYSLLLAAGLAGLGYYLFLTPLTLRQERLDFEIPPGSGLRTSIQQMREAGIELSPASFSLLTKVMRAESRLKAGSYEVEEGITAWGLLKKLTRGDVSQGELMLPEGWSFRQFRKRMNAHPDLVHETQNMSEADIMRLLGVPAPVLEGLLFPDTYLFNRQSRDIDLLRRAYRIMLTRLEAEWKERAPNLPYRTPYEALIMASIVEKETSRATDRGLVAAVFVNRLRRGMRLQTDPTVIYGMGERFDGNIRKADLQTDTPYNTYTRNGLPPTPISMPSLASLQAALHPAESDALYFVARGDGSSQFSRTLEEHNRAVNRYQRGRP